jgi:hypothetical protein
MEVGRWQRKSYKHGICLPTQCDNKHAHFALEVYKKDWQNALVDDTFSSLSNGIGVKELCQFCIL